MNRAIKFRAQSNATVKREWVYGSFIQESLRWGSAFYIHSMSENEEEPDKKCQVDYTTLGQYTGLNDKRGVEIYEGDLVNVSTLENGITSLQGCYQIKWRKDLFMIVGEGMGEFLCLEEFIGCEIIGNIYQTPELLNKEQTVERSVATM